MHTALAPPWPLSGPPGTSPTIVVVGLRLTSGTPRTVLDTEGTQGRGRIRGDLGNRGGLYKSVQAIVMEVGEDDLFMGTVAAPQKYRRVTGQKGEQETETATIVTISTEQEESGDLV